MTQTTVPPVRARARALASLVAVIAALGLALACAQTKRALGDECLKSEDCLSGICSQLQCAASPPLTSSQDNAETGAVEAGSASDTGADAGADTSAGSEGGDAGGEASSGD